MAFNFEASTANAVFYRSYSRRQTNGYREDWNAVTERTLAGLIELGNLTDEDIQLIRKMQNELKAMPSGRWLWVGGTEWSKQTNNFYGSYNCSNTLIIDWHSFGFVMNLAMQGCGTGTLLEDRYISQLPVIKNTLKVEILGEIGKTPKEYRGDTTTLYNIKENTFIMIVGDSRDGWVKAYQSLLEISSDESLSGLAIVKIDVSDVRSKGEKLKGFGGTANPIKLKEMFLKVMNILNKAAREQRQLTSVECCLLLDEAALNIVAGSIRRSASIRQFNSDDVAASVAKDNLWQQDSSGNWKIDPERDALRMANHTRVFHHKPTFEECLESATKQFYSGEGAIQWAGEAITRSNADLLKDSIRKQAFLDFYQSNVESAKLYLRILANNNIAGISEKELDHRMSRYGLNPCLSAGTMVVTKNGHYPIEALVGEVVDVWDGEQWVTVDNFRVTGENQNIHTIELMNGALINATDNHIFILCDGSKKPLHELEPGDLLQTHNKGSLGILTEETIELYEVDGIYFSHVADKVYCCTVHTTHQFALSNSLMVGNCGEVLLNDNLCNLGEIHLNNLDPWNFEEQVDAFKAAGTAVSVLLHHKFEEPRYQYSREIDPIVAVSFTGLFDFFVKAFGADWLRWWEAGRPENFKVDKVNLNITELLEKFDGSLDYFSVPFEGFDLAKLFKFFEQKYLTFWKETSFNSVYEYCDRNGLKRPNRCTALQPAGSKSLLTGASSGFAPPKAARYIRRITFAKDDAIAKALMDYGYSVVPSQSDKDENGNLLNDPFDSRCTEWLVEIPVATSWSDLPGCDQIDISKFSIEAQFDFMMQVQKYYVTHNISSTLEIRENEIEILAKLIYNSIQNDEGYISSAVLARFDSLETFPRLPFEPISKDVYEKLSQDVLSRRKGEDFLDLLNQYDTKELSAFDQGAAACDSDKCLLPLADPNKDKEPFVF